MNYSTFTCRVSQSMKLFMVRWFSTRWPSLIESLKRDQSRYVISLDISNSVDMVEVSDVSDVRLLSFEASEASELWAKLR